MQKIKENGNFIKNADEVKFEEFANYEGVANAVADVQFEKIAPDGITKITYVAEFKAGNQVITSNFSSQSINFMQRINDLKHYKVFRRADINLTKQAVINDWVSKGVTNDGVVQDLFKKYDQEISNSGIVWNDITTTKKQKVEQFLNSKSDWFDLIFNSNFQ